MTQLSRMQQGSVVPARSHSGDNTLAAVNAPETAKPSLVAAATAADAKSHAAVPPKDTDQKASVEDGDTKFGSAENDIVAKVAADIDECNRINGAEDFFGSTESRIREKLKAAYKTFRSANADPAYRAELVKQLSKDSGGAYTPSSKKPWCLAAFVALRPETKAHEKQTYDAAYFFRHADMAEVSLIDFPAWIENRNLKESIAFVRARKSAPRELKPKSYPNIAKAKKLKKDSAAAKILKDAYDMAEEELGKLFANEPI